MELPEHGGKGRLSAHTHMANRASDLCELIHPWLDIRVCSHQLRQRRVGHVLGSGWLEGTLEGINLGLDLGRLVLRSRQRPARLSKLLHLELVDDLQLDPAGLAL